MTTATSDLDSFAADWNSLDRLRRMQLRRVTRMGRTSDDPELARLAPAYARWQMQRPWMRLFWLWFVPGTVFVPGAAARIHPILIGVTIALGAQAVWAYFSLRKVARR